MRMTVIEAYNTLYGEGRNIRANWSVHDIVEALQTVHDEVEDEYEPAGRQVSDALLARLFYMALDEMPPKDETKLAQIGEAVTALIKNWERAKNELLPSNMQESSRSMVRFVPLFEEYTKSRE